MSDAQIYLIVIVLGLICVVAFNFVLLFGAPFLPTRQSRISEALDLLDLRPGQTLLELGSGDGRMLRAAAKRGIYSMGYELNPLLIAWSYIRSWRYRHLIQLRCRNFWQQPMPHTDGIYTFLLQPYMPKLEAKLQRELRKPVRLVSFAFVIPNRTPLKQINGLYLYKFTKTT